MVVDVAVVVAFFAFVVEEDGPSGLFEIAPFLTLSSPSGTNLMIESYNGPVDDSVSARDTASPRRSSTSYASREPVRRISSVRAVNVADRRAVCVFKAEIWD